MLSKIGEIHEGRVSGITNFGAFVRMENGESGMVHISEVADIYVKDIRDHLAEGQEVRVKVIGVNENNKISLSIKQADPGYRKEAPAPRERKSPKGEASRRRNSPSQQNGAQSDGPMSFEDMMAKFKKDSDEKISVLKKSSDFKGGGRRGGKP